MSKRKLVLLVAMIVILVLGVAIPATAQLNTGNVLNAQGVVQYASTSDDFDFDGSSGASQSFKQGDVTSGDVTTTVSIS